MQTSRHGSRRSVAGWTTIDALVAIGILAVGSIAAMTTASAAVRAASGQYELVVHEIDSRNEWVDKVVSIGQE